MACRCLASAEQVSYVYESSPTDQPSVTAPRKRRKNSLAEKRRMRQERRKRKGVERRTSTANSLQQEQKLR